MILWLTLYYLSVATNIRIIGLVAQVNGLEAAFANKTAEHEKLYQNFVLNQQLLSEMTIRLSERESMLTLKVC